MRRISYVTLIFGSLALFAAAFYLGQLFPKKSNANCGKEYSFINRDVICGSPDVIEKTGYMATQEEINSFVESQKSAGRLTEASVYFRDLVHGPTFGINELSAFAPASLLKLPLAFVYLASAEAQPQLLTTKLRWAGASSVGEQRIKPRITAEPDHEYTIEELLMMMIEYSDNASYETLEQFLSDSPHRSNLRLQIFQEVGLINPQDRIEETITVRGYASLFRILFNVSYLNAELSEKLLRWLTESDFDSGIKAGVPKEVTVANKFGERNIPDSNVKQLHDCGVVYYPGNPYLLCIMTKGNNWSELEGAIAEISRMTYEEVNSRRL